MSRLYLGVDAGNSKTVALVCDDAGTVLGWGRAGIGDIYGAPDQSTAVNNVLDATRGALAQVAASTPGGKEPEIAAAAFCLAGADWPEDHTFWADVVARHLPALQQVSVRNDGFATLRCGDPDGVGVAIAVGTGPAVVARGPGGRERCLGWWCFDHLGGSGLGERGLRAVYLAHQGLGATTTLTERLSALYGFDDVGELRHAFTRRAQPLPPSERNRAARAVLTAAAQGDRVALGLVDEQAGALAGYAWWVGREAGFDTDRDAVQVVLGGSVVTSEVPILRDRLVRRVRDRIPHARTVVVDRPAVFGALIEAAATDGATDLAARLVPGSLPTDLFTTD